MTGLGTWTGQPPRAVVDGQAITQATLEETVAQIAARARGGAGFTLFTLNLDHLVKRRADPRFRAIYREATFVTADGWPVAMLARLQSKGVRRTTGADLFLPVIAEAAAQGLPVALFGATQHSIDTAASALRARYPHLDTRLAEAPPADFDPCSSLADAAIERIAASGARLVFVALGAPKQEFFADLLVRRHPGIGALCIGAAIDFVSGVQVRAPGPFRAFGLEWLWRLATQPRRLALRYLRSALVLADIAIVEPCRGRARLLSRNLP